MNETPRVPAVPEPTPHADVGAPAMPGTAELTPELRDYPAQLGIVRQQEYSRFLPLVKWLLATPHFFTLTFLGIGAAAVSVIALFAVLITGQYPRGMFDFVLGVQRWAMRVNGYILLLVDDYPPFTMDDDPAYPVRLSIAYPEEGIDNWRPLVHWLLIFPYAVVTGALVFAAMFATIGSFFAILLTAQYPPGLFAFTEVALRWQLRTNAYAYAMTSRYPPFAWG
ncbi:MAG: DUF4389 domain-containing protein [Solirubrobacterales bacterium]